MHQSTFLGSCAGSAVKTHSFACIEVRKLQKYQVEKNYFFSENTTDKGKFHNTHFQTISHFFAIAQSSERVADQPHKDTKCL